MSKLPGDSRRDDIASLLRIKFQNVTVEKRLIATTADVLFVDDTNAIFPRSIAVESKDWGKRLSSKDLAKIYNLYSPSLASREIDHLWIIGREALSSSPRLSLDKMANVKYSTFDEFRASLMNFNGMLLDNILLFEHNEASKYFVETRARDSDRTLFDVATEWLRSSRTGLVVYGGYGLGKTTFSLHLARVLSKQFLAGEFDRIPIRIALGGMYSKQDLIALICSALSGNENTANVKDFSYGLFLEMSRQGQYLLILDGFDEMRHGMDLHDFIFTFEQMKPLFAGKAKVIILGRPDSFLSMTEEAAVLSALFDEANEKFRNLETVEVAFFSKTEVSSYLEDYLNRRVEKLSKEQQKSFDLLMQRLPDNEDNILSRPVQLKMFTKIMEDYLSGDYLLNRYELYRTFIYSFVDRELRKPARRPSGLQELEDPKADRQQFMRAMAWWLLTTKRENRFIPDEIPITIVPPSFQAGKSTLSAIREAIVGSVIEPISQTGVLGSKAKKFYYFPHKSYLEFLVADHFRTARFLIDDYKFFLSNFNNEILAFLEEGPSDGVERLRQALFHNLGMVEPKVIEVCAKDKRIPEEIKTISGSNQHPSTIYVHYFYLKRDPTVAEQYLVARIADSSTLNSVLATFSCIATHLATTQSQQLALALLVNCMTNISMHILWNSLDSGSVMELTRPDGETARAAILSRCFTGLGKDFSLSVLDLLELLARASRGSFSVNMPIDSNARSADVKVPIDAVAQAVGAKYSRLAYRLAKQNADANLLIPIKLIGAAADRFGESIYTDTSCGNG